MYTNISELFEKYSEFKNYRIINKNYNAALSIQEAVLLKKLPESVRPSVIYVIDDVPDLNGDDFTFFLKNCDKAKSAGILIPEKVYKHITKGNKKAASVIDRIVTPLVAIKTDVPPAEIYGTINSFMYKLLSDQFSYIININSNFAKKILRAEGLQSMVDYFKEIIHNPVAVYDESFECIIATDTFMETYIRIKDSTQSFFLNNLYFKKQRVLAQISPNKNEEYQFVYFPISYEKKVKAYLAVLEVDRGLSEIDYLTLEICATAILTEMKHQLAIRSIEEKNINNFIYDLLHPRETQKEEIVHDAKVFDLLPDANYMCAIINISNLDEQKSTYKKSALLEESIKSNMYSYINKNLSEWNHHSIIGTLGKSIVCIFSFQNNRAEIYTSFKTYCENLIEDFKAYYENSMLSIGVGNLVESIYKVEESYKNAQIALNYGGIAFKGNEDFIVLFNDTSILKLISSVGSSKALSQLIPDSLKAMQKYDEENNTELFDTLDAYLTSNCNARLASDKMFIHYKTMLYRLDKVAELFHFDLDNSDERLDLTLGLKILRITQ